MPRPFHLQVSLALATLLLVSPAHAQTTAIAPLPVAAPADVGMSAEKLALVGPAMRELVDEERIAGAIVAAARHGKLVLFEAVGWSDMAAETPLETDAILRFYSMTKPITSVAAMMLVEEGKIALDDPVAKYLPEFEGLQVFAGEECGEAKLVEAVRPMTVRDLLRHTAGLTYGLFGDTPIDQKYQAAGVLSPFDDLQQMTVKLSKLPLLDQPGERFNYSVSTDLLGYLVQKVSGEPLAEFFETRIFEPLGMEDTAFYVPEGQADRFSNNYGPNEGGGLRVIDRAGASSYLRPPRFVSGGGGSVSTAADYLRFCQMLLGGGELDGTRLLKAETVAEMTRNQLPEEAYPIHLNGERPGVGFGLGFSVIVEQTAYTQAAHVGEYGWGGAASTHFWISPEDDLVVVVLSQQMPFTFLLEDAVKPLVYDAIVE